MRYVAPIVEGHGEVEALPALLHRIATLAAVEGTLRVNPPIRVKSGSFLHDHDYFSKQIALAAAKAAQGGGAVLILLDCEDDCPATLGPDLLRRAQGRAWGRRYDRRAGLSRIRDLVPHGSAIVARSAWPAARS